LITSDFLPRIQYIFFGISAPADTNTKQLDCRYNSVRDNAEGGIQKIFDVMRRNVMRNKRGSRATNFTDRKEIKKKKQDEHFNSEYFILTWKVYTYLAHGFRRHVSDLHVVTINIQTLVPQ